MSTTILLLFSLLNIVCYLFITICVYNNHIVLFFFFLMYRFFVFFFSTSVMLSEGLCEHTFDGSPLSMGVSNPLPLPLTLVSLPSVHRESSHAISTLQFQTAMMCKAQKLCDGSFTAAAFLAGFSALWLQ